MLVVSTVGRVASAQDKVAPRPATLRGWADRTWLRAVNRTGATDGRLSRLGILQRFHETTDNEYKLDQISRRFSPWEDYEWFNRSGGFR